MNWFAAFVEFNFIIMENKTNYEKYREVLLSNTENKAKYDIA